MTEKINYIEVKKFKKINLEKIKILDEEEIKKLIKKSDELSRILSNIFINCGDFIDNKDLEEMELNNTHYKVINIYLEMKNIIVFDIDEVEEDEIDFQENNYDDISNDQVRDYLLSIGQIKLFTPEEEKNFFVQYDQIRYDIKKIAKEIKLLNEKIDKIENNDEKASLISVCKNKMNEYNNKDIIAKKIKDKITESNLKLAFSIAKRYFGKGLDDMDVIQDANLGLMKAVDKFDVTKGYKFSTYASWWIRQSVTRSLSDNSRSIRLPVHISEKVIKVQRVIKESLNEGKKLTIEEIAEKLDMNPEKVEEYMRLGRDFVVSLETPIGEMEHGEQTVLLDFVGSECDVEKIAMNNNLKKELNDILETFSERERDIIIKRFGFDDGNEKTLEIIGKEYNITRERVRQIEAKALRKLRIRSRNLKTYLEE